MNVQMRIEETSGATADVRLFASVWDVVELPPKYAGRSTQLRVSLGFSNSTQQISTTSPYIPSLTYIVRPPYLRMASSVECGSFECGRI